MRTVELRLDGHDSPDGQLRADRLAWIAAALDELILRLTREAASAPGLGRPGIPIERMGEVRLSEISSGTRLTFHVGDAQALDIDPLADSTDALFRDVITGLAGNARPAFVTPTIADATVRFLSALQRSAHTVDITLGDRPPVRVITAQADREVWEPDDSAAGPAVVAGRLEALDLRNAHFRIVDDLGNRIELLDVQGAEEAAPLINQRILAEGAYTPARGTNRSARMESVVIQPFETPSPPTP